MGDEDISLYLNVSNIYHFIVIIIHLRDRPAHSQKHFNYDFINIFPIDPCLAGSRADNREAQPNKAFSIFYESVLNDYIIHKRF